jgi:hypothetical protein
MIKKPRFYYSELHNYTSEALIEIILWHRQEMEKLKDKNWEKEVINR